MAENISEIQPIVRIFAGSYRATQETINPKLVVTYLSAQLKSLDKIRFFGLHKCSLNNVALPFLLECLWRWKEFDHRSESEMAATSPNPTGHRPGSAGAILMSAGLEARTLVIAIAGPLRLGENVKAVLARVARTTGLGHRRVRGIWNGEARTIRAEEMDRLRAAARDARTIEDAQHELTVVLERLAACEEALGLHAADLDRPDAAALVGAHRHPNRAMDRPVPALTGRAVGRDHHRRLP